MPPSRTQRSLRVTFMGLAANVLLVAVKMTAGILGHSHALIADAVESLADVFSSIIVWRGIVVSAAPPDEDHPYGHGKAEPLAAAAVASMLLLAAGWIAVESIREIIAPHLGPAPFTLVVLLVVVFVKEGLFRHVLSEGNLLENSAVQTDAWHHRSDAITSVAAGLGIAVAVIGGKGFEAADDIAALAASGLIAFNGVRLLKPALDELMDTSPNRELLRQIIAIAAATPEVQAVEKCVARKMGYTYFVDMHLEVAPSLTVDKAHRIAHLVKDNIRRALPAVSDVLVHIEPGDEAEGGNDQAVNPKSPKGGSV